MGRPSPLTLKERFETKVDSTGGADACWNWKGACLPYGSFAITHEKSVGAHRYAWELANGPIPPGMFVCHKCDNHKCVNPSHLFIGTHSDNMRDASRKNRLALQQPGLIQRAKGEQHHNSKLTEADVIEIRRLAAAGLTQRAIAKQFKVTQPCVRYIIIRKHWSHVA